MALALLIAAQVAGLLMIPLGLPGLWLMLAAGVAHQLLVKPPTIGWIALVVAAGISLAAEYLELSLTARYARKYGGSSRAGWAALLGGILGAFAGVPVPLIGSVIGAFAGSFLGALVAEYAITRSHAQAGRVAWGALMGRVVAAVAKTSLGLAIAVILVVKAF